MSRVVEWVRGGGYEKYLQNLHGGGRGIKKMPKTRTVNCGRQLPSFLIN